MENVDTNDTIDGGGGTDGILLTADNGTTGAVLDDLVDIDSVTIAASSTATENAKLTLSYTSSNTDAISITAAAMTSTDADFTFVGSDAEVGGVLSVTGGAGDDAITTGAGGDTIVGGTGADTITGGDGADTINAGAGLDTVVTTAGSTEVTISLGTAASGTGANTSITGYDKVTNLGLGDGSTNSETLNVSGTGALSGDVTNSNGTDVTGYFEASAAGDKIIVIEDHTIASGIVTFRGDSGDHGTATSDINGAALAAKITASTFGLFVKYLQGVDIGGVGSSVAFKIEAGTTDDLVVFTQGTADGSTDGSDQIVWIVGNGACDALITSAGSGNNDFLIA
jgi:hypothetical protein